MNSAINNLSTQQKNESKVLASAIDPTVQNPYLKAATSDNTRKAYQSDIRHFENWGGQLPAKTDALLSYLKAYAGCLKPGTLSRRVIALKHWHVYQDFPDPTAHPSIAKTLKGILRIHGKPKKKALPLSIKQLIKITCHLSTQNTLQAIRNCALLQLAFFAAVRRSELVKIRVEEITWEEKGIDILIPHSKTDQNHQGQYCAVPYGNSDLCAVTALKKWLQVSGITNGYIFRRLYKNKSLPDESLTPLSVNHILKNCADDAGINNALKFSSHSLRRGFATAASNNGASIPSIMRQGRWKSVNTVLEYIDGTQRFEDNAAHALFNK